MSCKIKKDIYQVLASNSAFIPITVKLSYLKRKNLIKSKENWFVIPPNTKDYIVTTLKVMDKDRKTKLSYVFNTYYGDLVTKKYNTYYKYHVPVKDIDSFYISQGYNTNATHKNINAIDFAIPEGTKISAARAGIVYKVKEDGEKYCLKKKCEKYGNYIIIYHEDGTFAEYGHLQKNGSVVEKGDKIEVGQHIGYSGNTGYSSGAHYLGKH